MNKIIFAPISINSTRNKFDLFSPNVKGNIDNQLITETKINQTFLYSQFLLKGYSETSGIDRDKNVDGIPVFIRGNIPRNALNVTLVNECLIF